MSTSPQIVPLTNSPNQTFSVALSIDGTVKSLQGYLHYNEVAGYWVLSIYDLLDNLILDSVPFVTGNGSGDEASGNLLGQFDYLGIGSLYILNISGVAAPDFPNSIDLGADFQALWASTQ
jgi:hypothetical protein